MCVGGVTNVDDTQVFEHCRVTHPKPLTNKRAGVVNALALADHDEFSLTVYLLLYVTSQVLGVRTLRVGFFCYTQRLVSS